MARHNGVSKRDQRSDSLNKKGAELPFVLVSHFVVVHHFSLFTFTQSEPLCGVNLPRRSVVNHAIANPTIITQIFLMKHYTIQSLDIIRKVFDRDACLLHQLNQALYLSDRELNLLVTP